MVDVGGMGIPDKVIGISAAGGEKKGRRGGKKRDDVM